MQEECDALLCGMDERCARRCGDSTTSDALKRYRGKIEGVEGGSRDDLKAGEYWMARRSVKEVVDSILGVAAGDEVK